MHTIMHSIRIYRRSGKVKPSSVHVISRGTGNNQFNNSIIESSQSIILSHRSTVEVSHNSLMKSKFVYVNISYVHAYVINYGLVRTCERGIRIQCNHNKLSRTNDLYARTYLHLFFIRFAITTQCIPRVKGIATNKYSFFTIGIH